MLPQLDPATFLADIARVENQFRGLERRKGTCALCRSADLRMHLVELRGLIAASDLPPEN
jgi:hypothetical protein